MKVSGRKAELLERLGGSSLGPGGGGEERKAAAVEGKAEFVMRFDGGSRGNPGPAACGYAIYGPGGEEIASGWKFLGGHRTNNYAEYSGLTLGLRRAAAMGVMGVAQGDSKLVVEQMSGNWKVKNEDMKALKKEADAVAEGWRFEWIRREGNKRADELANEGMDEGKGEWSG